MVTGADFIVAQIASYWLLLGVLVVVVVLSRPALGVLCRGAARTCPTGGITRITTINKGRNVIMARLAVAASGPALLPRVYLQGWRCKRYQPQPIIGDCGSGQFLLHVNHVSNAGRRSIEMIANTTNQTSAATPLGNNLCVIVSFYSCYCCHYFVQAAVAYLGHGNRGRQFGYC